MKDAVVKFKLLEHNIERLETRFRYRISQMRQLTSPTQAPADFRVNVVNSLGLSWEEALENISEADSDAIDTGPLTTNELISIGQFLSSSSALPISLLL